MSCKTSDLILFRVSLEDAISLFAGSASRLGPELRSLKLLNIKGGEFTAANLGFLFLPLEKCLLLVEVPCRLLGRLESVVIGPLDEVFFDAVVGPIS